MSRVCRTHGIKITYRILLEKPEGKNPLGSPRCKWVDYIKMGFRYIGLGDLKWINLDQDKNQWNTLVKVETNFWVPQDVKNFLSG
jgi:hypothetical protein